MNILSKLFCKKINKPKCNFIRLSDSTDEHFYKREYKDGFNLSIYKYSLELYQCSTCGKVRRKKYVWITLPNTGRSFYL